MAYTKTLWKTGDIVTQEKMNKIEQGIKSMELPTVTSEDDGKTLVVENGAWTLGNVTPAEPESAKDFFVLEAIPDDKWQTFSTTTTWNELDQARLDGRRIILNIKNPDGTGLAINLMQWILPAKTLVFDYIYLNAGGMDTIYLQEYFVIKDKDSDALVISSSPVKSRYIGLVTKSYDGLMSTTDKQRLDELYEDYLERQGN